MEAEIIEIKGSLNKYESNNDKLKYLNDCLFNFRLQLLDFESFELKELERLTLKTKSDYEIWTEAVVNGSETLSEIKDLDLLQKRLDLQYKYYHILSLVRQCEAMIEEVEIEINTELKSFMMGLYYKINESKFTLI